jgi:hypothetical protein
LLIKVKHRKVLVEDQNGKLVAGIRAHDLCRPSREWSVHWVISWLVLLMLSGSDWPQMDRSVLSRPRFFLRWKSKAKKSRLLGGKERADRTNSLIKG